MPRLDIQESYELQPTRWDDLRGARIFMTGGSGFFGTWLLETLSRASKSQYLGVRCVVLTRDVKAFYKKRPQFRTSPLISAIEGDVKDFDFPEGKFSHVIHAASPTQADFIDLCPTVARATIVKGTKRVLEFSEKAGARKILLTSSGSAGIMGSVYGEAKLEAEAMTEQYGGTIARCFSFIGPYLPMNGRFAAGNFIRDAMSGRTIKIKGDGSEVRSYLYMSDLSRWLWTALLQGSHAQTYNIGSDEPITIKALACEIAKQTSEITGRHCEVEIGNEETVSLAPHHYVPDVSRTLRDLKLDISVGIEDAISRTLSWSMDAKRKEAAIA